MEAAFQEGLKFPLPSYLSEEDKQRMSDILLSGGLAGPNCYYKVQVHKFNRDDESRMFSFYVSIPDKHKLKLR